MRHPKALGVLAAASLGLLAMLVLRETGSRRAGRATVVPNFASNAIEEIVFETPGATDVWTRTDPRDPEAYRTKLGQRLDPARVGSLLRALEGAEFERLATVTAPVLRKLTLATTDGPVTLTAHEAPPDLPRGRLLCAEARAARRCGVVAGALPARLFEPPKSYLALELLPWKATEVTSLERSGANPLRLVADSLGFRNAEGRRVSTEETSRFLRTLADLRLRVVESPEPRAPGDSTVTLALSRTSETIRFALSPSCGGDEASTHVVVAGGDAFCASGELLRRAVALGERLEARLSPLSADEIDHFRVEGPLGTLDVVRDGARFRALGESPIELERATAEPLFETLGSLAGELVEPPASFEIASRITLYGVAPRTNEPVKVTLGTSLRGERLVVRRDDDGTWLAVPSAPLFLGSPQVLRGFVVHSLPFEKLETIERSERDAPKPVALDRAARAVEELGRRLSDLHALRWLPEKPTSAPRFALHARYSGEAEPVVLRLFEDVLGGAIATSSRVDGAFVLPREAAETLDVDDWTGRHLLSETSAEASLRITARREAVVLVRRGDGWETTSEAKLDDAREVALAAFALTALRRSPSRNAARPAPPLAVVELESGGTVERVAIGGCLSEGRPVCVAALANGALVEVASNAVENLLGQL